MKYDRAPALGAVVLALSIVVSGCLAGPAPTPKLAVTVLSDADLNAQPNWTVGWAFEVFESVGDNQTAFVAADAPAGWTARFLKSNLSFDKANERRVTFLLLDVPETANGTYAFKISASIGGERAEAGVSVKVTRPLLNILKNGTLVRMDYVGFLETNQVFDTSMWPVANSSGLDKWPDFKNSSATRTQADYNALQLTLGNHQVIQGWELGLQEMGLAQGKALVIPPELAYGRFANQTINLTEAVPIYNQTTVSAFRPIFGNEPVEDAEYVHPVYNWTVKVVSIDNSTGALVYKHLPAAGSYTPYGVNATVANISSAAGTFELRYAPELHQTTRYLADHGEVVEMNAGNFTIRWQTEHRQSLAPYTLYFLVFVRTAKG